MFDTCDCVQEYNVAPWDQLRMAETIPTFAQPTVWVRSVMMMMMMMMMMMIMMILMMERTM